MSANELRVNQGIVIGCEELLPNGRKYKRFSGIPYAIPPVGELRFQPPKKLHKFGNDVLDCTQERDACLQRNVFLQKDIGSEDCLYLNVYVPENISDEKFTVMVYIHGGGFTFDSSSIEWYSPEFLLMEDVIVVTLNYRLHILGFLSLPSMGISGNNGLKDQQMALEWVHENISHFNGDPNKICLFGESAGATSVHLQVLNEKSRRFINSAICQSGSALCDWSFQKDGPRRAKKLAKSLGCEGETDKDVLETLMKAPVEAMIRHLLKTRNLDDKRRNLPIAFKPTIEPESENAFLTKSPIELIKSQRNQINIPIIFGTTDRDGAAVVSGFRKRLNVINEDMPRLIPMSVNINPIGHEAEILADQIKNFYFGTKGVVEEAIPQFAHLMTDFHFLIPQTISNELHMLYHPKNKQYLYEFQFDGRLNVYKTFFQMEDLPGACHADDIYYMFRQRIFDIQIPENSREWKMRETMCKLWTNFAKYGDPTPPDGRNPLPTKWTPVENKLNSGNNNLDYLVINDECKMVRNLNKDRMDFWRNVYKTWNKNFLSPKL